MSRGGRGGGRGGRGGGGMGGKNLPPMGSLTFQDLGGLDKKQSALYPAVEHVPRVRAPSEDELAAGRMQLDYVNSMRGSAYWPQEEQEKKTKDLGRYSDRYRPEEQTAPSITNIKLQEDVFPAGLWKSFMEGEERREKAKANRKAKQAKFNWDDAGKDDDEASDKGSASGDEEAGDPDAYEDDEDDDYGDNYFDNGEDRDEVEPTGAAEGEYE